MISLSSSSSDRVTNNDIDNSAFISGTSKLLPKNQISLNDNLNKDGNTRIPNIKEQQELIKSVYRKVTNLLSRAVIDGIPVKGMLEKVNLIPKRKKSNENIEQEDVRTDNDAGKITQSKATASNKAVNKGNVSHEYNNDSPENDNYENVSVTKILKLRYFIILYRTISD